MPKEKQRILLKFSGELFSSDENAIDMDKVFTIAEEINLIKKDRHIGVVFGGGNIFRGRGSTKKGINLNVNGAHYTGMVATIVNALALKTAFDALNIPSRVISSFQIPEVLGSSTKLDIEKFLKSDEILIFAAGTGNPFVSTDTAAVIRALEMKAEIVLKGTSVPGIFDSNPKENENAKLLKKMTHDEFFQIPGAYILDRTAVMIALENKLPIYVFKWGPGQLKRAVRQKASGTLIQ
jgi:uridylate kinase